MMAQKQIQKTRTVNPVTKTALTQSQSQEVVQVLLHGALSGLSYLRGFFSASAFDAARLSAKHSIPSYREYADGTLPASGKGDGAVNMKVLRRRRNKRVDVFLDWLEKGVFTALRDHRLARIRILAHPSQDERNKAIEAYTFHIKYQTDDQGKDLLVGVQMDSPGKAGLTVEATNKSLRNVLHHFYEICKGLPKLPDKRFVSMAISYREHHDEGYKLFGFESSTSEKLLVASADGWELKSRSSQSLDSAFHSASFNVVHLEETERDALDGSDQPTRIPSTLQYNVEDFDFEYPATAGGDQVTPADFVNGTPSTDVPVTEEPVSEQLQPEAYLNTPVPTAPLAVRAAAAASVMDNIGASTSRTIGRSVFRDSLDTQSSDAPRMKMAAKSWMQPEHYTQGDTQTQPMLRPQQPTGEPLDSPMQSAASIGEEAVLPKVQLLPAIEQQLEKSKAELREAALQLAKPSGSHLEEQLILCQCGHEREEGAMVECSYCETWQHLHCYGFTGKDDRRLPTNHACYQCIVGKMNKDLMATLCDLALKRRAMDFATQNGLSTKKALATYLGVSSASAGSIWDFLRIAGFVEAASPSRKSSGASAKKSNLVAVRQGPSHEEMLRTLFNPLSEIGSYYFDPSEGADDDQRSTRSPIMPPPKMPASQVKKRKRAADEVAFSPSSDLDIGPAAASYGSPHRIGQLTTNRQVDRFSTPAKRQATSTRVRTMQSIFVLNADGMSSSPAAHGTPQ